jgi:hypothetical protein
MFYKDGTTSRLCSVTSCALYFSTNSEAVEIGMKMKAKFILLTHFSQRYPKLPMFDKDYNYPIGLAFDFMKVSIKKNCHCFNTDKNSTDC